MSLGGRTDVRTWRITLSVSIAVSIIALLAQYPTFIYTADVSFHAAKILRASSGEFFIDPLTGTPTIYPSLFHFLFGGITRIAGLSSLQCVILIISTTFIGLFIALYFLARVFMRPEEASACAICLPLVLYAPTARFIFLAEPGNFSFVPLLFGVGALYRYLSVGATTYLILAGFLLSLAVNIWWSNIFSVGPLGLLALYVAMRKKTIPPLSHVLLLGAAILIPACYTVWHFASVSEILSNLGREARPVKFLGAVAFWLTTFLTKGNLQFTHYFYFWDLSKPMANIVKSGLSLVHYFLIVLPFNLLLNGFVGWTLIRGRSAVPELTMGGIGVLLGSAAIAFAYGKGANLSHMRRVHFLVYLMFLVSAWSTASRRLAPATFRTLSICVCAASLVSLSYTLTYSTRASISGIPESDQAVVRFVATLPNHPEQRVFMMDAGVARIAPFVTFRSFVGRHEGRYYWQDPVTASAMYADFVSLKQKHEDWRDVADEMNINWMIFRVSQPEERAVFEMYESEGTVVLRNRDWVVLSIARGEVVR